MRGNFNLVSTFECVGCSRLPMFPHTLNVGNAHCIGRLVTHSWVPQPNWFWKWISKAVRSGNPTMRRVGCSTKGLWMGGGAGELEKFNWSFYQIICLYAFVNHSTKKFNATDIEKSNQLKKTTRQNALEDNFFFFFKLAVDICWFRALAHFLSAYNQRVASFPMWCTIPTFIVRGDIGSTLTLHTPHAQYQCNTKLQCRRAFGSLAHTTYTVPPY